LADIDLKRLSYSVVNVEQGINQKLNEIEVLLVVFKLEELKEHALRKEEK